MPLTEQIPDWLEQALKDLGIGRSNLLAAVASDLSIDGRFGQEWLVLTADRLLVFDAKETGPSKRLDISLSQLKAFRVDSLIGGGALCAETGGTTIDVVRYTYAKEFRFGRIARYINEWIEYQTQPGDKSGPVLAEEIDEGQRCAHCGLILPEGTRVCPKCLNKGKVIRRILRYLKPYWRQTTALWILMILGMAFSVVQPYLTRPLMDDVLVPAKPRSLEFRLGLLGLLVLGLAAARILAETATIFRGRILAWLGSRISHDLRFQLFRHLQVLSLRFFDKRQTGAIMARVMHDTQSLQGALLDVIPYFVIHILTFVGICVVLFAMNWKLALLVLIPAPLVAVLSRVFWKWVHRLWHRLWFYRSRLNASINDSLSGVRVVKAFAQESQEIDRFGLHSSDLYRAEARAMKTQSTLFPVLGFIIGMGSLIVWFAGGRQVVRGEISIGTLMTFIAYLGMFYGPLQFLSRITDWLARALTSAERIFEILDTTPDVIEAHDAVALARMRGEVAFRDVTFGYDKHKPALRRVSLAVRPGEMIGLVGHSGAGKSTTINLLLRLYDVDEGHIFIDGIDIRHIRQQDLRAQIGIVLQDTFLFSGTIAENIGYAKQNATREEILSAAKAANAHDFILRKPDGYDTRVGERGVMLSGGERQRVAIARAILHNPRILILDEATSSVDTDTEKQIQEAIARLIKGRTTFAIAHRLSTLRNADRLIVLKEGQIAEMGTHDELLEKKGEFHRLVEIQSEISKIKAISR